MFSISGCCLLLLPLLHQKIKCLKFESSGCGSSVCAKNMHGERLLWDTLRFDVSRVFYYGSWADLISRSIHLLSIAQMCLIFLCFFSQWERIVSVKGRDNIYFQTCSTNTRFAYSFSEEKIHERVQSLKMQRKRPLLMDGNENDSSII